MKTTFETIIRVFLMIIELILLIVLIPLSLWNFSSRFMQIPFIKKKIEKDFKEINIKELTVQYASNDAKLLMTLNKFPFRLELNQLHIPIKERFNHILSLSNRNEAISSFLIEANLKTEDLYSLVVSIDSVLIKYNYVLDKMDAFLIYEEGKVKIIVEEPYYLLLRIYDDSSLKISKMIRKWGKV